MEQVFTAEAVTALLSVGGTPAVILLGFWKLWTRQDGMDRRLIKIETLLEAKQD